MNESRLYPNAVRNREVISIIRMCKISLCEIYNREQKGQVTSGNNISVDGVPHHILDIHARRAPSWLFF